MTIKRRGGARAGAGRKPAPLGKRKAVRGKVWIGIAPEAALQLQQLMLRGVPGVTTPEQMVEYLIRRELAMTILTDDALDIYNQLDRAVGSLLKQANRPENTALEMNPARYNARIAAQLRDRIATTTGGRQAEYIAEARQALATGEWWNVSLAVGGSEQ